MKIKILLFFFFASVLSQAQSTSSYENDIKHFIEVNGTMKQYQAAVDQLMHLFKEQYKDSNVNGEVWKEVKTEATASLEGLLDDLVVVYKKVFTHQEIKDLNKLFEKEIAQKYINNVSLLTEASQDPSIVWSRNLYNKLTDLLYEKGYTK